LRLYYGTSRGKNALKLAYLQKALSFLESEIDLLKLAFLQSNRLPNNTQSNTSKVYFIPNSQGLGIDSMGEFAVSFELSHQFVDETGKPAPFIHIVQALGKAFNFTFGDAYKSKARIFSRKPYNLTKGLDTLRNAVFRESKKRSINKDEKR
jgi:hypothetical protein